MKKLAALLVLVLAALSLGACGSSSSPSTTTTSGAESEGAASGEASGGGSTVAIEAAHGTELAYATPEVSAKAGNVTIDFTNPQQLQHDVVVEDSEGETLGEVELVAAGSATTTINGMKPGKYTFFCSVPGHRDAGMEGTLTIK